MGDKRLTQITGLGHLTMASKTKRSETKRATLLSTLDAARTPQENLDPRRIRTRAALMEAAQKLFATRAIDAVSVEDITEAAIVAKGSFYNHFTDKNAIAEEIFSLIRDHAAKVLDDITEGEWTPTQRIARGGFAVLKFALEHPESASALHRLSPSAIAPDTALNMRVRDYLRLGMADRSFRRMSIDAAVLFVIGIEAVMLQRALAAAPSLSALSHAGPLLEALLVGLGVDVDVAEQAVAEASRDILDDLQFRTAG